VRAERQLILFGASTALRRSEMNARAEQLMADVDWERLTVTLRQRRLLPTLGPRICGLTGGKVSEDFAAAVEQAVERGRRHGTLLQLVCLRVMSALADAEIQSAPLKGPLLAEMIYGDVGRRLSNDVDVLVAPEQLYDAVKVVRGLGYAAPADYVEDSGLPMVHFALAPGLAGLPPVELHWRTHWYDRHFARERLLPPTRTSPADWRPAPVDELVSLLLFYARDGFVDLRLAADVGAWWDAFGSEVQPGALVGLLRTYPALARTVVVAMTAAEMTVGLPTTQILGDAPRLNLRDRMAIRLANPNPDTRRSQLYADMGLIDGLLAPPGGFGAFARRQVFLPQEVFDERAEHIAGWRSKSRFGYSARALARFAFAMTRLLRSPEVLE